MKHVTKANNLRDLWKSYTRSFWPNDKIHIKPTKCLIFLTMTSGEVLFFEYQGGFCAQAGWGGACAQRGGECAQSVLALGPAQGQREHWPRGLTVDTSCDRALALVSKERGAASYQAAVCAVLPPPCLQISAKRNT